MNTKYILTLLSAGVVGFATMACEEQEKPQPNPALQGAENTSYPEGAPVTKTGTLEQGWTSENASIQFADGRYSGNTGCNDFTGTYKMTGENSVLVEPMVLTRKMCADNAVMQNEANFAKNFPGNYDLVFQGTTVGLVNNERSWVFATAN